MASIAQPDRAATPVASVHLGPKTLSAAATALRTLADLLEAGAVPSPPAPPVEEADPLLTVAEASVELRRCAKHVRAQCVTGAIKAMRDGRGWLIRRSALRAYERRRTA